MQVYCWGSNAWTASLRKSSTQVFVLQVRTRRIVQNGVARQLLERLDAEDEYLVYYRWGREDNDESMHWGVEDIKTEVRRAINNH